MKLGKMIAMVDNMKPNQYTKDMKTKWLSEVEGTVVDEILNLAAGNQIVFNGYDYNNDVEKELLVPDTHLDIYQYYLFAKIDYQNSELERYNNDTAMFYAALEDYAKYYRRTHRQKPIRGFHNF